MQRLSVEYATAVISRTTEDLWDFACYTYKVLSRALCALAFVSTICLATVDNVVDLGYAKYRGNVSYPNTVAYLGIPYAEPPLGDLRFRAPVPLNTHRVALESNGEVVDADVYPDFCVQGTTRNGDRGGAGTEDCLKVNVYAPRGAKKGDKLPVLFYIHGGGYMFGTPDSWPYDHWIHQVPEVIVVSIYYRIDAFGFLSHPAFTSSPELGDHNVGYLDQIEALRWVQRNIEAFGGDPTRVTIDGESAGASSVELHLVTPESAGLFSGAIAQSVYRTPLPSPEEQVLLFDFFAGLAGCGEGSVVEQIACLRQAPISAISPAQDAIFDAPYNVFRPVFDGKIISVRPTESILRGRFTRVPLIVGAISNETSYSGPDINTALKTFFPQLSSQDLAEYNAIYSTADFADPDKQLRDATGESQFRCAVEYMGDAFAKEVQNVYTYRYNTPANAAAGHTVVDHAAENWLMFNGSKPGCAFSPL
ncbi:hypothetical protein NM688_g5059 [Phlebia brevispora]|uniref:Uncharacterized protein n=1 Tax=Phlebia brevispora TaxID=194682 RepID=A0ACC1T0W2_9APHY|nr:hypothetical protein NM688_g5059 [Phlebia brevispora]